MKRYIIAACCLLFLGYAALGLLTIRTLRAETPFPATPGCPHNDDTVAVCYDLQLYYNAIQANLYSATNAVPEDKFFQPAPGITTTRGESSSIGAEVIHAAETQSRMCTLLGYKNPNWEWEKQWDKDPQKLSGAGIKTKADAIALLRKSFDECDPYFRDITEASLGKIMTGNHGPKPQVTTLFNAISHDREVYGRIQSFMAAEGLRAPGETQALTPKEKKIEDAAAAAARANNPGGAARPAGDQ